MMKLYLFNQLGSYVATTIALLARSLARSLAAGDKKKHASTA